MGLQVTVGAALRAGLLIVVLFTVINRARAESSNKYIQEDLYTKKRHIFSCKNENDNCYGVIRCCGTTQCYWEGGYSPFRAGKCVMCVESGLSCQRDSNCCGGLQCDKLDLLYMNGVCKAPRTSGACYRNSQCRYKCKRAYYKGQGHCTSSPENDE